MQYNAHVSTEKRRNSRREGKSERERGRDGKEKEKKQRDAKGRAGGEECASRLNVNAAQSVYNRVYFSLARNTSCSRAELSRQFWLFEASAFYLS